MHAALRFIKHFCFNLIKMNNMKSYKILTRCLGGIFLFAAMACSDNTIYPEWIWDDNEPPQPPVDEAQLKPRYVWIDAAANFPDYANSKENILKDLAKAKDAGFTDVVVDVRPTMGDVLFSTSVVDPVLKLDVWGSNGYEYYERTETWDYLQAFIDAGHDLGLRVNAAINTFVGGNKYPYGLGEQGFLFRDPSRKEWATTLNLEAGLYNVMDLTEEQDPNNLSYGTRFLNPANPEVQQFMLDMLKDLAKYDVDGIFLDRCRYNDFESDFSDVSRTRFEEYIGETVPNFPEDVVVPGTKYNELPAILPKHCKKWLEFRAKIIHDFVVDARDVIKTQNPEITFGVYVGAWYSSYYEVGVNWGSPKYNTALYHPKWATVNYKDYGYADHLDFMLLGAYAGVNSIEGEGEWTVQGFCKNARQILLDDVEFAGGPDVGNGTGWGEGGKNEEVVKTVDVCMAESDGYFVFDMVHVKGYNYWDSFKTGFDNYLNTTLQK